MFLELELLIASFILFLMLFCAFEAFDRLSGGQIMKLEKELEAAVRKARIGGLTAQEICETFQIIMEDGEC